MTGGNFLTCNPWALWSSPGIFLEVWHLEWTPPNKGIIDRQLFIRGTYFSLTETCWKKISKTKMGPLKGPYS